MEMTGTFDMYISIKHCCQYTSPFIVLAQYRHDTHELTFGKLMKILPCVDVSMGMAVDASAVESMPNIWLDAVCNSVVGTLEQKSFIFMKLSTKHTVTYSPR